MDFVMNMTAAIRQYSTVFGGCFSMIVLVQLILTINLWNLRARFKKEAEMDEAKQRAQFQSSEGITIGVDGRGSMRGSQVRNSPTRPRGSSAGAGRRSFD